MLKPAAYRLLPAALFSAALGLTGCHVSFSSGSGSKSPSSTSQGKPAKKSPSKASRPANTSAKPVQSRDSKPVNASKPASPPPANDGPTRADDKTSDDGPKRTQPSNDPQRVAPSDEGPKRKGGKMGRGSAEAEKPAAARPSGPTNMKAPQ